ncbi:hypothetical protein NKR19_g8264 [Coniochaeta hoffmannii]|uniref:2EXR domain-containing protein n=1 Tax=Coniochaeta hoffmannii TaxID=91930 RepID=A0AA38VNC5_9PEZI|nr:hypothetical protein NKR19_g8264 [Coniochaeta hoffmannii]
MSSPKHIAFSRFPQLPTEIRLEIWRLCLPRRVVELGYQVDETVFDPGELPWWYRTNHKITDYNTRVPVIARVCRESRQVVFETWTELSLREPDDPAYWSEGWGVCPEPWFDRIRTDCIHNPWYCVRDIESPCQGDPIRNLLWAAAKTHHIRVSISMDFLLEHAAYARADERNRKMWTRREPADLMRQSPEWTVVLPGSIIVTTDDVQTAAATDLFGLLGDSRVQIVDSEDDLDEYVALNGVPGVTLSFSRFNDEEGVGFSLSAVDQAIVTAQSWIPPCVTDIFGSGDDAPKFHLGIMFRLSTKMGGPEDGPEDRLMPA